ncbi:MAG: quinolinate synthase NadA [Methanomassiliicoccales archaeon]|nr:quinolinate synthase NadA [Methanomassiliicoccales archaeon]
MPLIRGKMSERERILELKKEKNAVILAHNYQRPEVQDIADFVGDSLGLSKEASKVEADVIVFCGVDFMAESAKILNPQKIVVHPEPKAKCPMAAMCEVEELIDLKRKHPSAKVVGYVNTTAACKTEMDICCTSSNAVKVVGALPEKEIIFVPDENLGKYVQRFVKDKNIILWPGFCPTHDSITPDQVKKAKEMHPDAVVIVHPECRPEVIDLADAVKSTEGMVKFVKASSTREFIIVTEKELIYRLKKENPEKTFYSIPGAVCPTMKMITLSSVLRALENLEPRVELDEETLRKARSPLERMMEIGRGD